MDIGCPVCNGLALIVACCSRCGTLLTDAGRLENNYADYSPYREIDDLRLTNNFPDLNVSQCLHVLYCNQCQREEITGVSEKVL